MCRVTPDVFFLPFPPFRRARARGIAHTEKYGWLARLGTRLGKLVSRAIRIFPYAQFRARAPKRGEGKEKYFKVFSARARGIAHTEKYGWLARLGENQKKKDQGKESGQRDYTGTAS